MCSTHGDTIKHSSHLLSKHGAERRGCHNHYRSVSVVACRQEPPAASTSGQPGLADLLVENTWKVHLDGEFKKPYFQKLEKFLKSEWSSQQIFPPKDAIFRSASRLPMCIQFSARAHQAPVSETLPHTHTSVTLHALSAHQQAHLYAQTTCL